MLIIIYTIRARTYRIAFRQTAHHSEVSAHLSTVELVLKCAMGSNIVILQREASCCNILCTRHNIQTLRRFVFRGWNLVQSYRANQINLISPHVGLNQISLNYGSPALRSCEFNLHFLIGLRISYHNTDYYSGRTSSQPNQLHRIHTTSLSRMSNRANNPCVTLVQNSYGTIANILHIIP